MEAEFPPKRRWAPTTPHPQVSVILVCRRYCLVGYDVCSRLHRNEIVTSQITVVLPILKLSKIVSMLTGKYLPTFRKRILLSFIDQVLNWTWAHYDSSKRRWLYRTSLDSSDGIVRTLLVGRSRGRGKKVSFSQNGPNRLWSPFRHLFVRYRGSFPGAWHSPSNIKVKNEWSYTFTLPICVRGVDKEYFTFFYLHQLVETSRYKPEGRGFVSRLCHWNFLLTNPSGHTMTLGLIQPLTEMSTRNISWGVKAADA